MARRDNSSYQDWSLCDALSPKGAFAQFPSARGSFFLQAIEGEDTEVEILFEKIKHDPRHHSILKVYKNPITERTFSDWTMGFNLIDDADPEGLDGYSDFLSRPNTEYFLKSPSRAKILLESFKERVYF